MHNQLASEDSDSDSLPDITKIWEPPPKTISPGDIVWAKFKHLYWPALVRTCYPSQKKISVWYCDEPGKTFKLPSRNVCLFHDKEMGLKILKDVKEAGCMNEHEGLRIHACRYLQRKAAGYKDDPMKFFDQTYPFFLVEEMLKKDPTANVSDIKIPPLYITNEKKQTIRKKVIGENNEPDDSEVESIDSDSTCGEGTTNDYITQLNMHLSKEISQENTASCSKEIDDDKIVEYILSGKADDYLLKIKLKKLPSEHRDLFELCAKKQKNMNEVTFNGPVEDDAKLRKLIFYLLPLYENVNNEVRNKRFSPRKSKVIAASQSFSDVNIGAQYVASVWLPESIIFAISKIKNVSLSEAKQLFTKKSESKTKAIEKILSCVDTLCQEKSPTDVSEIVQANVVRNKKESAGLKHSADTSVHSKVKKMRIDKSCIDKKSLHTCVKSQNSELQPSEKNSSEDEFVDEIFNCILSGKANDYLKNIKLKCIPSDHLNVYEQSVKCNKKKLSNITYTGPMKDDDKVRKLIHYLLPLYADNAGDSHKSKRSAARKCRSSVSAYYVNEKNPSVQYVLYVWLPESIIFAISHIKNVPLPEAKKLFDAYAEAKCIPDIIKSIDAALSG